MMTVWIVSLGDIGESPIVWDVHSSLKSAFKEVEILQGILYGKWTQDHSTQEFYAWTTEKYVITVKSYRVKK